MKKSITSLLKIEEWEKELLNNHLIEFYINANSVIIFDELVDIIDNNDYIEIIDKYKKDLKNSISRLSKFMAVLNDKIVTNDLNNDFINKIKELNSGKLFPLKLGNFTLNIKNNNLVLSNDQNNYFNFKDNFYIKDLERYLTNYYNRKYLNTDKTVSSKPFKFIFGEKDMTPFEFLNGIKNMKDRIELKRNIQNFIKKELETYISNIENHKNKEKLKELEQRILGKTRTTVKGILPTAMVLKKNGLSIEIINKFKKENIEELLKVFKKIKHLNYLEIDPNTSIERLTQLLKNIENSKFKPIKNYNLKIRFLGNYNATGLYFNNTIAVDLRTTFAFVHEFGHHYFENQKNKELIKPIENYISFLKKKMYNVKTKREYYYKPTEIFARSAEIAYLLHISGFKPEFNDNKYFTPEKIENLTAKRQEFTNGFVNDFDFYKKNKNIYFDFLDMTNEELSILYSYHSEYLNLEYKTPIKNIEQEYFDIYRIEERKRIGRKVSVQKINRIETMLNYKEFKNLVSELHYNLINDYRNINFEKIENFENFETNKLKVEEIISKIKNTTIFKALSNDKDFSFYVNKEEVIDNIKNYYLMVTELKNNEVLKEFDKLYNLTIVLENKNKELDSYISKYPDIEELVKILPVLEKTRNKIKLLKIRKSNFENYYQLRNLRTFAINLFKNNEFLVDNNFYKTYEFEMDKNLNKAKEEFIKRLTSDIKVIETAVEEKIDSYDKNIFLLSKEIIKLTENKKLLNEEINELRVKNGTFVSKMAQNFLNLSSTFKYLNNYLEKHKLVQELFKNEKEEFLDSSKRLIDLFSYLINRDHDKHISLTKLQKDENYKQLVTSDKFINIEEPFKYTSILKLSNVNLKESKDVMKILEYNDVEPMRNYALYNLYNINLFIEYAKLNFSKEELKGLKEIIKNELTVPYFQTKEIYKNNEFGISDKLKENFKKKNLQTFEEIFTKLNIKPELNKKVEKQKNSKKQQLEFNFNN